MTIESAQLSVEFQAPNNSLTLTLEYHSGQFRYGKGIPLRLYPAVPAILRATKGSLTMGETRVEDVDEVISFSGGTTSKLKRPLAQGVQFYPLDIALSMDGRNINPVIHYDSDNDEAVSDQPFHGAYRTTYQALYKVLYYNPDTKYTYLADGSITTEAQYGTAYAFYLNSYAKMEVNISIDRIPQYQEYYRVISTIVLDSDGSHEMPPHWKDNPPDGHYPGMSTDKDLDPDNSLTEDRIHEIGYVDNLGVINPIVHRFYAETLPPYAVSGLNYHPIYHVKWAQPSTAGLDENEQRIWRQAFAKVNKQNVLTSLKNKYEGLTES